jgi:hypothetical protein
MGNNLGLSGGVGDIGQRVHGEIVKKLDDGIGTE